MTEKPILFNGEMVRAILDGRKTVTRRPVKPQPEACHDGHPYWHVGGYRAFKLMAKVDPLRAGTHNPIHPPYSVGDLLWVRETHAIVPASAYWHDESIPHVAGVDDDGDSYWAIYREGWERSAPCRWLPSIHMPRWASRITLEVTAVTVERVQDISDEDAMAEGAESTGHFCDLWDSLYGDDSPHSLGRNPLVWRIAFRRVHP